MLFSSTLWLLFCNLYGTFAPVWQPFAEFGAHEHFGGFAAALFSGKMRDYVAEGNQRGDWVGLARGDSRSWRPRWNMKALCASAPNGNTRALAHPRIVLWWIRFLPAHWLSRRWRVASVCFRGGMWQPGEHPPTSSQLHPLVFVFTILLKLLLHRAMKSLSSSLCWPAWRFSQKGPAADNPERRHTIWALPVTDRKWPAFLLPDLPISASVLYWRLLGIN